MTYLADKAIKNEVDILYCKTSNTEEFKKADKECLQKVCGIENIDGKR